MNPRVAVFCAVVVLSVAAALVSTKGSMGAPPSALGLLALGVTVGAVGAASLRGWGRWWRVVCAMLVLALAGVAAQDFLRPGVTYGHDIPHHSWALWSLWRCVLDGDWFPRWNPYLSLGIPLLQFYAPLPYIAAWPAQALGASPMQALAWLIVWGQWMTGLSLLASVRWLGGSWLAGLLAAAAAMLAPYHLMDQTFRLALGETMAFPFVVPFGVAAWKLARGNKGKAPWVLGLCAAGLLVTHLITLIMASLMGLIVVVCGVRLKGRSEGVSRKRALATLALTAVLTSTGSAVWLLPVVAEMHHTAVSSVSRPGRAISPYAVVVDEPVTRRLWSRYDIRYRIDDVEHPGEGMPMYFGWALLALLGLGLARPRTDALTEEDRGLDPRLWGGIAFGFLLLAIHPLAMVLDGAPLIGRIMFPWRLYAPASVLAALTAGLALDRWVPAGRARSLALTVSLAALAVDVAPYLGAASRLDDHEGLGLVEFKRGKPVPVEGVPRDRFVRIEDVRLPPSDYDWQLSLGRRAFPEYMAPKLRRRYGRSSKPPTREQSEFYGASYRIRRGVAKPLALNPEPMVSFRPNGRAWLGLANAQLEVLPELLTVTLPPDLPEGEVRVSMGWFPGWEARVDGGSWADADKKSWLLAMPVPAGANRVVFRYSALRPWDRSLGLGLSVMTWLALLGTGLRRKGPEATTASGPDSRQGDH